MGRVVVLGSLNVDVVTRVDRHPRPGETLLGERVGRYAGGKGGNQALAARRAGAQVVLLGQVGADDGGAAYLERLRAHGVATPLPPAASASTGTAYVTIDDAGENTIIVVPGANAELDESALAVADFAAGDVLLATLEVPLLLVEKAVRAVTAAGGRAVLNLAPYASLDPEVIALAAPVVVNESEMRLLADSDLVPTSLVVTFGSAGSRWDGLEVTGIPVPPSEVGDTVGAGDAFCGALAAALAAGAEEQDALRAANEAGAAAVRWAGAQPDAQLP